MYKQVIVIRKDLELSKGKLAAQVAHASLEAYRQSSRSIRIKWEREGSKKVILKVGDLKELMQIFRKAKASGLPCCIIRDAGKTEVRPGTITALGIGPSEEEKIDAVTGHLKML